MAKKTSNPFQSPISGDDSCSQEKIMKRNELIDKYYVNSYSSLSPKQVAKYLKKPFKGWSNVNVKIISEYDEDNEEKYFIGVFGDRLETTEEKDARIRSIIIKWLRDYEDFLRKLMFYKSSMGKAQVKEILKKKWIIWSGYPESTPEFKKAIKEEREKFEKD